MQQAIALKSRSNAMALSLRNGQLAGFAKEDEKTAKGKVAATLERIGGGEPGNPRIGMNAAYIADFLKSTDADKIELTVKDEGPGKDTKGAMTLRPLGDAQHTAVIMPMRDANTDFDDGLPKVEGGEEQGPATLQSRSTPLEAKPSYIPTIPAPEGLPRPHLENVAYNGKDADRYWNGTQSQPAKIQGVPILWVNNAAMDVIGNRIHGVGQPIDSKHTGGMALSTGEIEHFLEEAGGARRSKKPFDLALLKIAQQVRQVLGADASGPLVVVQAGSHMLAGQVNRILIEELNHALQMQVPRGLFGLPTEFLDTELGQRAVEALRQAGYQVPNPKSPFYERNRAIMAAEVSVRLMHPALYPELGLSLEEAVEFATQHAEALVAKHGNRAAAVTNKIYDTIQSLRTQAAHTRTDRGIAPQLPGSDRGVTEGRAARPPTVSEKEAGGQTAGNKVGLQSRLPGEVGPHGPILRQFHHDAQGALAYLLREGTGDAIGALHHPGVGDFDLTADIAAKLRDEHPEVMDDLQGFISKLSVLSESTNRIILASEDRQQRAAVRLDYDGVAKRWLLSAYDKNVKRPTRETTDASGTLTGEGTTAPSGRDTSTITPKEEEVNPRPNFLKDEEGSFSPSSVRANANTRLEKIGNAAAQTRHAKGALTNATEALKTANEEVTSVGFGEKVRTLATGTRDYVIAETNQLRDTLQDVVPKPKEQEALSLYRDFKKRPGELQEFLDGTHPFYNELVSERGRTTADQAEAIARVQKLEPVIQLAQHPTPAMLKADQALTDYFTEHLAEGRKIGFLDSSIDNDEYITHLLKPAEKANQKPTTFGQLFRGKFGPKKFRFAKERAYPTVLHALAGGAQIRTLNALDALGVYGEKYGTTKAYHVLKQAILQSGAGKWGSFAQQKAGKIPGDWVELAPEHNLFRTEHAYVTSEGEAAVAHQNLFVPPKLQQAMKAIIDPNYMANVPGFQHGRTYQAYVKTIELGLSFFHLKALNITALANENLDDEIRTYASDMQSADFLQAERAWIRAGLVTPVLDRTVEVYQALRPSSLPNTAEKIRSLPGLKQIDQFAGAISHLTFGIVQRKMKVTDASFKYAAWLANHATATPEEEFEAQRQIAKQVNATYGGLNWENIGVHRMTTEISKALMLAPDWTYSNLLNAKYAFEGGPGGNAARAFWIRGLIWMLALTAGTSLLLSGKLSKDPTKVMLGKDPEGNDVSINMFFVGGHGDVSSLVHDALGYGAVAGLARFIGGKLGPFPRTAVHQLSGRDALDHPIVKKTDSLAQKTWADTKDLAKDLAPVPFSIGTVAKMLLNPNREYTKAEYAWAVLNGRMPQVDRSEAAQLALDYAANHRESAEPSDERAAVSQAKSHILAILRSGRDADGAIETAIDKGLLTEKDVGGLLQRGNVSAFQYTVSNLNFNEALDVFAHATPAERDEIEVEVQKLVLAASKKPEAQWTPTAIQQAQKYFDIQPRE